MVLTYESRLQQDYQGTVSDSTQNIVFKSRLYSSEVIDITKWCLGSLRQMPNLTAGKRKERKGTWHQSSLATSDYWNHLISSANKLILL